MLPTIGPWALYGLLFTIVILFALQGGTITSDPLHVVRIALPLLVSFGVTSGQALAGVVGPLIEVPTLVGLVYLSLWARLHLSPHRRTRARPRRQRLVRRRPSVNHRPSVLFVCVHNDAGRRWPPGSSPGRRTAGSRSARRAPNRPTSRLPTQRG